MNILYSISWLILLSAANISATETNYDITTETMSWETLQNIPGNHLLGDLSYQQCGTFIKLHKNTDEEDLVFLPARLVHENGSQIKPLSVTLSNLKYLQNATQENAPLILLSSRGYLPGERVVLVVASPTSEWRTSPIVFIPNPVIIKDKSGEAIIDVVLNDINPTNYTVNLSKFRLGEKLLVTTFTNGERLTTEMVYKESTQFSLLPDSIGRSGGTVTVTVQKSDGEKMKVKLPWGEKLTEHHRGIANAIVKSFDTIINHSKN